MGVVGVSFVIVAGITVVTACLPEDETADTLGTLVPPATPAPAPATTADGTTTVATTTSAPATTTTLPVDDLPTGDWTPGVRYDIGVVRRVTSLEGHPAIEFDRYSYAHPVRGVIDAEQLGAEPIEYWYTSSPFFNVSRQLRTFVLSPDVEVLVLAEAGRDTACGSSGSSGSSGFPEPTWEEVDASRLGELAGTDRLASLTYSPHGVVVRIRFTRGC